MRRLDRQGWVIGIGVGVLLFGGFVLQTIGLSSTSPGVSGFLTGLYVIMVPDHPRPGSPGGGPRPWWAWALWSWSAGSRSSPSTAHLAFGWGEIFTLLATVFWALHILGVAYGSNRLGALAFVQLQLATCAVLSLAGSFVFEGPALFPGWAATGAVLWTGIMGSLVAYVLMVVGQRYTPPTLAGVIMSLEAVFALIFSIIVGYDTLTGRTLPRVRRGVRRYHLGPHRHREGAGDRGRTGPAGAVEIGRV